MAKKVTPAKPAGSKRKKPAAKTTKAVSRKTLAAKAARYSG